MNLEQIQLNYLNLLKGRKNYSEVKDEYFSKVVKSDNFKVLNDIVIYWRAQGIYEYCRLTSSLLIKLGIFQDKITGFYKEKNFSNYIEELGKMFLEYLTEDENGLISFISEFELSLIKVKLGSKNVYTVGTFYNPDEVFNFIMADGEFPSKRNEKAIVKLSSELENNFSIEYIL